jgi:hypothetical protein
LSPKHCQENYWLGPYFSNPCKPGGCSLYLDCWECILWHSHNPSLTGLWNDLGVRVRNRLWSGKHPSMCSHPTVGGLQREVPPVLSCSPGPQSVGLDSLGTPLCLKLLSCNLMSQKREELSEGVQGWPSSHISSTYLSPYCFFPHVSPLTQTNNLLNKSQLNKQVCLQREATKTSLLSLCFILISPGPLTSSSSLQSF